MEAQPQGRNRALIPVAADCKHFIGNSSKASIPSFELEYTPVDGRMQVLENIVGPHLC
jgi:hypothetical protein